MVHISSVSIQCEQYIFSQTIRAESTLIKREISETEKKNLIKIFTGHWPKHLQAAFRNEARISYEFLK